MNTRRTRWITGLMISTLLLGAAGAQAQFSLLHEFAAGNSDGAWPYYGAPVISGSTLYGLTPHGGDSERGTVFKMNTDGSGFSLLREFAGGANDGRNPYASPTLSGSTLYGVTAFGGDSDLGTVFKMNTDGSGFNLLHEFAGGAGDGRLPQSSLTLSGSTLYGMTDSGGANGLGNVFKVNTDGTGFSSMHEFTGGAGDGSYSYGSLTLSGSTLYGMTYNGGDLDYGTVFKMNTDGSGFSLLREFAGGANDGRNPYGSLTLSGSTLYGMTRYGGDNSAGTVFKMNTDGSGFSLLHEFAGGASDGSSPVGDLTLYGSTLYGMTMNGGSSNLGTVFQMNTDGSGFQLLHGFAGGASDGSGPQGSMTLSGSTLYGMTVNGGDYNKGTVFALGGAVPEPSSFALVATGGLILLTTRRRK